MIHCIWSCPISQIVLRWVQYLLQIPSADCHGAPGQYLRGTTASLTARGPCVALVHSATCCSWKDRCCHFILGRLSSLLLSINPGLDLEFTYTCIGLNFWAMSGLVKLSIVQAVELMDFGSGKEVWYLHEDKLQVPPVPPRPPQFSGVWGGTVLWAGLFGILYGPFWVLDHWRAGTSEFVRRLASGLNL